MTTATITTLTPDDWELFRDLRLRALADAPAAFGSRLEDWREAPEERWRQRLEAVPLNLAAVVDGRPVGMASGTVEVDGVELISMWVDPTARGTGMAGELVDAVVTWAAARGCGTYLMVRTDNARAIRAYERVGFVDQGMLHDHPTDRPPENRLGYRAG